MAPSQSTSLAAMFFSTCSRKDFNGWYKRINGQWVHYSREELRDTAIYTAIALKKGTHRRSRWFFIYGRSPRILATRHVALDELAPA